MLPSESALLGHLVDRRACLARGPGMQFFAGQLTQETASDTTITARKSSLCLQS